MESRTQGLGLGGYTYGSVLCPLNPAPYHMDNFTEVLILVPECLNPGRGEFSGEATQASFSLNSMSPTFFMKC